MDGKQGIQLVGVIRNTEGSPYDTLGPPRGARPRHSPPFTMPTQPGPPPPPPPGTPPSPPADYDDVPPERRAAPQPVPVAPSGKAEKRGQPKHQPQRLLSLNPVEENDLSATENLNQEKIVEVLKARHLKGIIHTYIADVLLVVNPYRPIDIYTNAHHDKYKDIRRREDQPPHLFYIADKAYQRMRETDKTQCILVSGESGAGKTESTKYMIRHLVRRCYTSGTSGSDLHDRIIKLNPLLEAFGNAETTMNHNSSRFGKYIDLIFNRSGRILGATIHEYLLEKSRVVHHAEGEMNYHIFYYMFAGMPEDKLKYYWLEGPSQHRIMTCGQQNTSVYKNEDHFAHCKKMFKEVESLFYAEGFSSEDMNMIFACLAAILYITNVEFAADNDSVEDGIIISDDYPVESVSDQLMVDRDELTQSLISTISQVGEETVFAFKTLDQARDGRDALAKTIYQRLFSYIVFRLNEKLTPKNSMDLMHGALSLGILDFSGFENFSNNGFEQLCINIANEQLQFFFNNHILGEEQEEYRKEGVDWVTIDFQGNKELLDLFTERGGMLSVLDDQSRFPQADDRALMHKWKAEFSRSPYFIKPRGDTLDFLVKHYAGEVEYSAEGFLEKNRDCVGTNLMDTLKKSRMECLKDLFSMNLGDLGNIPRGSIIRPPDSSIRGGPRGKPNQSNVHSIRTVNRLSKKKRGKLSADMGNKVDRTVCQFFNKSLQDLMRKMKVADPLFVRCIKPNEEQVPKHYSDKLVGKQLLYNGVLQIAEIRKRGYPIRMDIKRFIDHFHKISSLGDLRPEATAENCHRILNDNSIPKSDYVIGKRKVFMKEDVPQYLDDKLRKQAALIIQKRFRAYKTGRAARLKYKQMKENRKKKGKEQPSLTPVPSESDMSRESSIKTNPSGKSDKTGTAEGGTSLSEPNGASGGDVASERQDDFDSEEEIYSESEDDSDDEHPSWDIAQLIPRDRISPSESFSGFLKALRALTYIIIFLLVWICATAGTGCVLLLTAALRRGLNTPVLVKDDSGEDDDDMEEIEYKASTRAQLLWIICFPHILLFLVSFFKSLFGNIPWPSPGVFIFIMVQEILTSFGVVLMVVYLLPDFGSIYCLGLMNSIFLVPAFLKLFFSKRKTGSHSRNCKTLIITVIDFLVLIIQICAVGLPVVVGLFKLGHNYHYASANNQTMEQRNISGTLSLDHVNLSRGIHHYWQWPLALFLVSIKWWENFVATNRCCFNLFDIRKVMHATRAKMSLFTSIVNIAATVGFVFLMEYLYGKGLDDAQQYWQVINPITPGQGEESSAKTVAMLTPAIIAILCSLVCYYCCGLASKLLMQEVSYALPLFLATPTLAAVIVLQCRPPHYIPLMPVVGNLQFEFVCDMDPADWGWYIAGAVVWWLSGLWLAGHIWFPTNVQLSMAEKLFVTPFYVGPLIIPSMMMNRRRNDNEIVKTGWDSFDLEDAVSRTNKTSVSAAKKEGEKESAYADPYSLRKKNREDGTVPLVYACATMWHETKNEMVQLLKSVFRMDLDQGTRRFAQEKFKIKDPNYYEYETHIFFDDAMELNEEGTEWMPNQFVHLLMGCLDEAASSVWNREKQMMPPWRIATPYGGRLIWKLPAGTNLVVHLKDKQKIRHKKRWSQVMYMYYLLGYRIFGEESDEALRDGRLITLGDEVSVSGESTTSRKKRNQTKQQTWLETALKKAKGSGHFGKSAIFKEMNEILLHQAENTFVLALDGDVDFKPDAVRLLIDRMKKNEKTGAACGRIHPIGSGPLVWYQIFEYAVGHWFQKATEHVLGCVLCSPGCFSLFRGSALMDDNVMKRYTTKSTEASNFLQYDQGEDRWLCTLLLQQGYRVDYTAAADALTYAPEGFDEFFNQRRRWVPSTMANIMDLLSDFKNTVLINDNISYLYILYQFFLMVSTVLGPATIVLMIASAYQTVFKIELWQAYILSVGPIAIFIGICIKCKTKVQLGVAKFLSTMYAGVMTVVLVGIIKSIATESLLDPSLMFLTVVVVCFLIAGIFHPYEIFCLVHGILYFLCIPSGYLILMIYSMCNLHVVSWGTREVAQRKTKEEKAAEKAVQAQKAAEKKKKSWFQFLRGEFIINEVKEMFNKLIQVTKESPVEQEMLKTQRKMLAQMRKLTRALARGPGAPAESDSSSDSDEEKGAGKNTEEPKHEAIPETPKPQKKEEFQAPVDDIDNPAWLKDDKLGHGDIDSLETGERIFWDKFIKKYLVPLKKNPKKEKELAQKMIELRNNANFGFWMINGLWVIFNYMLQIDGETNRLEIGGGYETEPLGFVFLIFFLAILLLQMIGMIIHRWGTFLQLIAITELNRPCKREDPNPDELTFSEAHELTKQVITEDPPPDYDEEAPLEGTGGDMVAEIVRRRTTKKQKRQEIANLSPEQLRNTIRLAQSRRRRGPLPEIPGEHPDDVAIDISADDNQSESGRSELFRHGGRQENLRPGDTRRGRPHAISNTLRRRYRHRLTDDGDLLSREEIRRREQIMPGRYRPHDYRQPNGGARPREPRRPRFNAGADEYNRPRSEQEGQRGMENPNFARRRRQRYSRKHYFHGDEFSRMWDRRMGQMYRGNNQPGRMVNGMPHSAPNPSGSRL